MRSRWIVVLLLYGAIATSLGHVDFHLRSYPERGFTEIVPAVINGTEFPPGRYRVLGPYAYEGLRRMTGLAPATAWVLFRWLCLFAGLLAMHWLLRAWFDDRTAVLGAIASAALLPLTFTNSWAHPDHLLEWGLFALAMACLAHDRFTLFVPALALCALNRETSVFLLPLALGARPISRRLLIEGGIATAIWATIYVLLRVWKGAAWYDPWNVSMNLTNLGLLGENYDFYYRRYAWFFVVLALPGFAAAASAWARLPRLLRTAAAIVAPMLLAVGFLFSSVIESRIFTPLLPLMIPVIAFALGAEADRSTRVA